MLAHVQDPDDLNVRWQHPITNQKFLDHNPTQVRKNSRFDPVTSAWVFAEGNSSSPDLAGECHFNPASKLATGITPNLSPIFLGEISESNPQSSSGSVKKSGGQSSSFAPRTSLSFSSRAAVAA